MKSIGLLKQLIIVIAVFIFILTKGMNAQQTM